MKAGKFIHWSFLLAVFSTFALASHIAAATTDFGTLTKGTNTCGYYGYAGPWGMGSYSPTGLAGGTTVTGIYEYFNVWPQIGCTSGVWSAFVVGGFSSNPSSNWLNSVTCNGVTLTSTSANFSYSNGNATWFWSNVTFKFSGLSNGTNVSCTIDHN